MRPCHHSNSRHFLCVCGESTPWLVGNNYQSCPKCQRWHVRGSRGPKGSVEKCEGQGTSTFGRAVDAARYAFIEEMYRMGFRGSAKTGRVNLRVRGRGKNHEGFSMTWTAHFEGDGPL